MASTFVIASVRFARICCALNRPIAVAERMPMIATVIVSSIRVKPARFVMLLDMGAPPGEQGGPRPKPRPSGFRDALRLELALAVEVRAGTDRIQQVEGSRGSRVVDAGDRASADRCAGAARCERGRVHVAVV